METSYKNSGGRLVVAFIVAEGRNDGWSWTHGHRRTVRVENGIIFLFPFSISHPIPSHVSNQKKYCIKVRFLRHRSPQNFNNIGFTTILVIQPTSPDF